MSLFWRVFITNAVTLTIAGLVLALSPATVSDPLSYVEALTLVAGLLAMFAVNAVMLRQATRPLRELRSSIEEVQSPTTDQHVPAVLARDDVGMLTDAYRHMLHRLEDEREQSVRRSLSAQEAERSRVSAELHDEIGQSITVLLLRLGHLRDRLPDEYRREIAELTEDLRSTLDDVRSISARLRPGVLEDLGLRAALTSLARESGAHSRIATTIDIGELPPLAREQELVIYRVAQEAVTNVLRHAGASAMALVLSVREDQLCLTVADNGSGVVGTPGVGMSGMRERARLVQGQLTVTAAPDEGTSVELSMPVPVLQEETP